MNTTPGTIDFPVPSTYLVPKELAFIFDRVAPVYSKIHGLLREFSDNEVRVAFLQENLSGCETSFLKFVNSMRRSKDPISLETAIRLFGVTQSYDLLVAMRFWNAITGERFLWDKNSGRPVKAAGDLIPFAIRTREFFGEDSRYQAFAFSTGLVFDLLFTLNQRLGVDPIKTKELLKSQFEEGLKIAKKGLDEGKHVKGLKLEKYLISLVLLKRTGRIVMAILNKEYLAFANSLRKQGFRSRFAHLAEQAKFQVSNNMVSALLCKFVPELRTINAALLFYDYPFMLNDGLAGTDLYDLVRICADLQLEDPKKIKKGP